MAEDSYGYTGDGFEFGHDAPPHSPSLPDDGDPLFHSPTEPEADRHGVNSVFDPSKGPFDAATDGSTAEQTPRPALPQSESEAFWQIIRHGYRR